MGVGDRRQRVVTVGVPGRVEEGVRRSSDDHHLHLGLHRQRPDVGGAEPHRVQSPTVGAGSALSAESVTATATVPSIAIRIDSAPSMTPVNATGSVLTTSVVTTNSMQKVFVNGQWKTIGPRQAYVNGSWKSF